MGNLKLKKNNRTELKSLVIYVISVSFFEGLNLISVDYTRPFFQSPQVTEEMSIGYMHYFGYPNYFDTLFFLIIVFIPIIVAFVQKFVAKNVKF